MMSNLPHSMTAVLERHAVLSGPWETEPFETAWASQAIFFLRVEEIEGDGVLVNARVQISPDGIHWADEGTCFDEMRAAGQFFVRLNHFGGWLRLVGQIEGPEGGCIQTTIHLVLKEN